VRGQRLFIRPIDPSDRDSVRAFLQRYSADTPPPETGLLARLVGDLVAVLGATILPSSLRIDAIVVRDDLRRKQIGRYVVDEAEKLALKLDRDLLIVEDAGGADDFFRRLGFQREGNGPFMRRAR
jgi:ribosomal protein S18 acetylase RimI-like enzyme